VGRLIKITQHVTIYAAWEDGADERENLGSDSIVEWHYLEDVATHLRAVGATEPSSSPYGGLHTWYSTEGYEHPYSGELEESSFHLDGLADDEARAIYTAVTNR